MDGTAPVVDECNGHFGPTHYGGPVTYHYHVQNAWAKQDLTFEAQEPSFRPPGLDVKVLQNQNATPRSQRLPQASQISTMSGVVRVAVMISVFSLARLKLSLLHIWISFQADQLGYLSIL